MPPPENTITNGAPKSPKLTPTMTMQEVYGPAMKIQSRVAADKYLSEIVAMIESTGKDYCEAIEIAKANLGYYAGYYDAETRRRVECLFECAHPIFGAIAERGQPSQREAFEAGRRLGKAMRTK